MNLDEIKNTWTVLGDKDPMWAIMNDPACRQDPWTGGLIFFRPAGRRSRKCFKLLCRRGVARHWTLDVELDA